MIRNEKGQGIVEFSLILFLFMMMVLGIFEVGRLFLQYTAVANAAQEAARYASLHGTSCTTAVNTPCNSITQSDIETYAVDHAAITGVTATAVWPGTPDPGTTVTVTVTSTFEPLLAFVGDAFSTATGSSSIDLTSTVTMAIF